MGQATLTPLMTISNSTKNNFKFKLIFKFSGQMNQTNKTEKLKINSAARAQSWDIRKEAFNFEVKFKELVQVFAAILRLKRNYKLNY